MSLRSLTARLQEETEELRRRRQFDRSRSRNASPVAQSAPEMQAQRQTTFMSASGRRQPAERPVRESNPLIAVRPASRQVGLREHPNDTPLRIPGGIVARFGRNALQDLESAETIIPSAPEEPTATNPEPEQPSDPMETAGEDVETQERAQPEREAEEEATRITIELQSH